MVDTPSRRAVLATTGTAVGSALGGCSLNNPEVQGGHLFVENLESNDFRIFLEVTEGADREGDQVVSAWYRIPPETGLQFGRVLEPGTTYTVTVHRPTVSEEDSVTVTIPPCQENGNAARNVSVRTRVDGMGIIPWGCDEDYTRREIDYANPEEFRIDPPQTTETTEA